MMLGANVVVAADLARMKHGLKTLGLCRLLIVAPHRAVVHELRHFSVHAGVQVDSKIAWGTAGAQIE